MITTTPVMLVDLDQLTANDNNLRHDLTDIDDLAESITAQGLLQPLLVVPDDTGTFTVIGGNRRLAALQQLEWAEQIPVLVRTLDGDARTAAILAENGQRVDLTALEEAAGYQRLADLGHSQREIAGKVGRSQAHISRRLALLDLPAAARAALDTGRITIAEAVDLANADLDEVESLFAKGRIPNQYDIGGAIRRSARRRYEAEARTLGQASGLPEITDPNYWQTWNEADAEEATAWRVGSGRDPQYLIERPATSKSGVTGQPGGDDVWRAKQAAEQEERARRDGEFRAATEARHAFVRSYLATKPDLKLCQRFVNAMHIAGMDQYIDEDMRNTVPRLLGLPVPDPADVADEYEADVAAVRAFAGSSSAAAVKTCTALWVAVVEDGYDHAWKLGHQAGELDTVYWTWLAAIGFEPGPIDGELQTWAHNRGETVEQVSADPAPPHEQDPQQEADIDDAAGSDGITSLSDAAATLAESDTCEGGTLSRDGGDSTEETEADTAEAPGLVAGPDLTPPWSTYTLSTEARILKTLRDKSTRVDTIAAALAYEEANGQREAIVAACRARLDEVEL